jgi:hypothetical protein
MTGRMRGVPVQMLDRTIMSDGSECRYTVVLLPAPEAGLPKFELQPRGCAINSAWRVPTGGHSVLTRPAPRSTAR